MGAILLSLIRTLEDPVNVFNWLYDDNVVRACFKVGIQSLHCE